EPTGILFLPPCVDSDHSIVAERAIACIDSSTCAFSLSDLAKMDARRHFPLVSSAENLGMWESRPARIVPD
ncbi:hypothetical protein SB717_37065, partial [Priestia sp. SIMBA_032]|uniref:hypothetical protein n=1 Tax=Priestia sp. SIMBA_032 TaxID=3085775 RepID=UPI00397C118E